MTVARLEFFNPETVHPPLGQYSQLAVVPPGARFLVLAGQVGIDLQGQVPVDAVDQFHRALGNALAVLQSQGAGPQHIVKLNSWFAQQVDYARVRAARIDLMGDAAPPSTFAYVAALVDPRFLVEVEVWAALPE